MRNGRFWRETESMRWKRSYKQRGCSCIAHRFEHVVWVKETSWNRPALWLVKLTMQVYSRMLLGVRLRPTLKSANGLAAKRLISSSPGLLPLLAPGFMVSLRLSPASANSENSQIVANRTFFQTAKDTDTLPRNVLFFIFICYVLSLPIPLLPLKSVSYVSQALNLV